MADQEKETALGELRKRLLQHKEIEAKVKTLRDQVKESKTHFDKTEDDLKALQSVGQIIGEVLRQLDKERCKLSQLTAPGIINIHEMENGVHADQQKCLNAEQQNAYTKECGRQLNTSKFLLCDRLSCFSAHTLRPE